MTNLQQLRHFVAVAEQGSFARAAEQINLSQPALSRSIQTLESSLNCQLLDRHSRGLSLTAHGQLVLEHARRLLAGGRALRNAVMQLGNLEAGELLLGSGPYPAARLVPQALGRMVSEHPRVKVKLLVDNWRGLRSHLLSDELELFVADIRHLEDDPLLHVEALGTYPGVICCRPDHPLAELKTVSMETALTYPLAATQLPLLVARELSSLAGREEPVSIQCDNFMVLRTLAIESDVLAIAPWDVVAEDVTRGTLIVLQMDGEAFQQKSAYGLVSRAGHSLSPAALLLRQHVLDQPMIRPR
ncbi:MAG: LysR family transcriptional regulator [Pseudomonas sp.]